jgi:hypothetical protein
MRPYSPDAIANRTSTMERDSMQYTLQLEMLERNETLSDREAIALLHDELMLAQNAGRFLALSPGDVEMQVVQRNTPQEGVTGYVVRVTLEERASTRDDEHAARRVEQAFTDASNASYFLRVCTDDRMNVRLVSRSAGDHATQLA